MEKVTCKTRYDEPALDGEMKSLVGFHPTFRPANGNDYQRGHAP